MRKTFRKRIKISKLKLQGLLNSDVMRELYIGRILEDGFKALSETVDRLFEEYNNG